ncbi:hypothetical protein SAMN04487898_105197 [Pedobacter sp. ok626]|uniref:hypothetical protein n=1 Tax=Pedobacter sp. ok626 TaxID=1761882 RepID=UPI000881180F|nr:hypothetical protein [Pedobacter sp. ok626]SDJ97772.1 hypothetical protein SAMN04487898_105197 [Pedobacter sp. ok626]
METRLWMQVRESLWAAAKKAIYGKRWSLDVGFSTVSKKWYKPEEFMVSIETVSMHQGKDDGSKYVVKDPLVGLQEGIDLLERTHKEIDAFNKKIHNYYGLKPK